ncbi:MAG TPA: hypothetical protein VIY08_12615, partial [Candidatus Nitrosocosmicus sp.]
FQINTLLIFIIFKKDNTLAAFLNDKPKNYKYNPYPIIFEGVIFLADMLDMVILKLYVFP